MAVGFRSWLMGVGFACICAAPLMASDRQDFDKTRDERAKPAAPASLSPSRRQQLVAWVMNSFSKCWTVPPIIQSTPHAGPISVTVQLEFDRDGRLASEPRIMAVEFSTEGLKPPLTASFVKEALRTSVINAVKKCTPLNFVGDYRDHYEMWRRVRIKFMEPRS